jgi:hypothetical protein
MITKLPDELRQAIQQSRNEVRLEDDQTHAVYVIVDEETHRRAMKALQEQEDWQSVQRGLANRANGREMPLAEADALMRKDLGFPPRS